jgi:hypothetical protein
MSTLTIDCDNDITALVKVPADADRSSSGTQDLFIASLSATPKTPFLKMQVPDLPLGSVSLYSSM